MSTGLPAIVSTTSWNLRRALLLFIVWTIFVVPTWKLYVEPKLSHVSNDVSSVREQVAQLETATSELKAQSGRGLTPAEQQKIQDLIQEIKQSQDTLRRRDAENAVARTEVIRLSQQAAHAHETLKVARQHIATRTAKLKAVATSDSGRKIVADKDRLRLLVSVIAPKSPDEPAVVAWEQRLSILREQLLKGTSPKNPADVGPEFGVAVTRLIEEIEQSVTRLQDDALVIERLMAESRAATPVNGTAEEVVNAYRQQQATERVALVEETRRKAQVEQTETLAKVEAMRVEAEARVKQQELENETSRLKAREKELALIGSTEAQQRASKLAREKLKAEVKADVPEMEQLLAPFIVKNSIQLNDFGFSVGEFGPLSLGRIKGRGALAPNDVGLERLYWIGGDYANRRPRGSFPSYSNYTLKQDAGVREKVQRAQQLLIKYGDYLVEEGFLAP